MDYICPDMDEALRWARHVVGPFEVVSAGNEGRTGTEFILQRAAAGRIHATGDDRLRLRIDPYPAEYRTDRETMPYPVTIQALRDDPVIAPYVPEVWGFDLERGWTLSADVGADTLGHHPSIPRQVIATLPDMAAHVAVLDMPETWDGRYQPRGVSDYDNLVDEIERSTFTDDAGVARALSTLGMPDTDAIVAHLEHETADRPWVLVHGGLRREVVRLAGDAMWVEGWEQLRYGDAVGEMTAAVVGLGLNGPQMREFAQRWADAHAPEQTEGMLADADAYVTAHRILHLQRHLHRCARGMGQFNEGRPEAEWARMWAARRGRVGQVVAHGDRPMSAEPAELTAALRVVAHAF